MAARKTPANLVKDKNSGMWNARWKEDGRSQYKSLRTRDRREAEKLVKPIMAAVQARRHGVAVVAATPRGPSWAECVQAYRHDTTWPKNPNTQKRYLPELDRVGRFLAKRGLGPGEATRFTVADYVNDCRRESNLSASSLKNALTPWSRVIDTAVHLGMLPSNYVLEYQRRRIQDDAARIHPPLGDEFDRLLPEVRAFNPDLALFVDFLHRTGCRVTEVLTAKREQIFADDNGDLHLYLTNTKGGSGRERAPLLNAAEELLDHLPARGRLFPGLKADAATVSSLWGRFFRQRRAAEEAAAAREGREIDGWTLRRWRLHDHRHAFAINALRQGVNVGILQMHLGHASVAVTERYTKEIRRLPLAARGQMKLVWKKASPAMSLAAMELPGAEQPWLGKLAVEFEDEPLRPPIEPRRPPTSGAGQGGSRCGRLADRPPGGGQRRGAK